MHYSDREYLSKFLIDPEFEDLASHEEWEDLVSPELLANEDALDVGDGYWDETTDRG
jgi:hypothetical protein